MVDKTLASRARKALLRRGRAILRLRQDFSADHRLDGDEPDFHSGLTPVERRELDEIHAALARLDRGVYGRCEQCSVPIGGARLEAAPWARSCSRCADDADHMSAVA